MLGDPSTIRLPTPTSAIVSVAVHESRQALGSEKVPMITPLYLPALTDTGSHWPPINRSVEDWSSRMTAEASRTSRGSTLCESVSSTPNTRLERPAW